MVWNICDENQPHPLTYWWKAEFGAAKGEYRWPLLQAKCYGGIGFYNPGGETTSSNCPNVRKLAADGGLDHFWGFFCSDILLAIDNLAFTKADKYGQEWEADGFGELPDALARRFLELAIWTDTFGTPGEFFVAADEYANLRTIKANGDHVIIDPDSVRGKDFVERFCLFAKRFQQF